MIEWLATPADQRCSAIVLRVGYDIAPVFMLEAEAMLDGSDGDSACPADGAGAAVAA